jgi:hypothetical protein
VPTGALDEAHSYRLLELGDPLADGRLHVAEAVGGAAKRLLLSHRGKGGKVPKLDSSPFAHVAIVANPAEK